MGVARPEMPQPEAQRAESSGGVLGRGRQLLPTSWRYGGAL